eukprot:6988133-Heterocapsa_arctica.AAC.1
MDKDKVEGTGATWCHYCSEDWDLYEAARRAAKWLSVEPDRLDGDELLAKRSMPYSVIPAAVEVLPYLI